MYTLMEVRVSWVCIWRLRVARGARWGRWISEVRRAVEGRISNISRDL